MKLEINKNLLPVKAHFFFFFAALGPILPQLNVFGRQLGVSPEAMGLVTAVLPLLWAIAKPTVGYVVDFWPNHRKFVFMLLIIIMSGTYCSLWFLPMPKEPSIDPPSIQLLNLNDTVYLKTYKNNMAEKFSCHWNCSNVKFGVYLSNETYVNAIYVDEAVTNRSCSLLLMEFGGVREGEVTCIPKENCTLLCYEQDFFGNNTERRKRDVNNTRNSNLIEIVEKGFGGDFKGTVEKDNFYKSAPFWWFVVLMCIGTVGFNVASCISDAVCFDVLGPKGSRYGAQRAWGTLGYGVCALVGGWAIDLLSQDSIYKDFTPAFVIAAVATVVDLYACTKLNLPSLSSPEDSGRALLAVLRIPRVMLFITFAVVAGTFDSFSIYYMFWFLEELAEQTGHMSQIKLIEGVVTAAQSLIGELIFFYYSGKIIKRWGYGVTMTFSLFCYGVKMALVAFIQNPWHLVYIEAIMQGPTYALCYSCIVGYAAHVAPAGYSATVQGIVAGMDDGLGFAIGSLLGGWVYGRAGGRRSFLLMGGVAIVATIVHAVLYCVVAKEPEQKQNDEIKEEGEKMLPTQINNSAIYRDTVVPLRSEDKTVETVS